MKDLTLTTDLQKAFPTIVEGLQKAQNIFSQINSFEDIERIFLKGAGLSPNTYRSYLEAVKQFYQFTEGLNPLQVKPADIESFYDDLVKRVDRKTAYLRIRGLKKFFSGIRNIVPFYTSPFEIMSEKLNGKLNRTKKGNRTKKALNRTEIKRLLTWLKADRSIIGMENYAICFMLITSGLRASELLQLRYKDIDYDPEGKSWTGYFTGKGNLEAEQELYPAAVQAAADYFKKHMKRQPKPDDSLFYTDPVINGNQPGPMTYPTLWWRISEIGKAARESGIITRELQFSPHLMRRSYATLLNKSGMGLKAIQEKTRHSNIETLAKHYIDDSEAASPYLEKALA